MNTIQITQNNKENTLPIADLALYTFFDVENYYFKRHSIIKEVLPENINPRYCDKVVASFTADLDLIVCGEKSSSKRYYSDVAIIKELVYHNERYVSDCELAKLFEQAKERTVFERALQTNIDDVQSFYYTLKDYTLYKCWQVLCERIQVHVYPIDLAVKKFQDIDIDYFDFTCSSEELHPKLTPEYQCQVVDAFTKEIDEILSSNADDSIRIYTDDQICKRLQCFTPPIYTIDDIAKLYENAKRLTLLERLTDTNKSDIIAFHHALMDATVWKCKKVLDTRLTHDIKL